MKPRLHALPAAMLASLAIAVTEPVHAAPTDEGAQGFAQLYVGLCMKNFTDLPAFRARALKAGMPRLPPESAKHFLGAYKGDAWPVPYKGKAGNYVLAVAADKNLCEVFARRADADQVEREFLAIVKAAPAPMLVKVAPPVERDTPANGRTRTVAVTWSRPGTRRSIQFMLTTSKAPNAELQALGTVATISQ